MGVLKIVFPLLMVVGALGSFKEFREATDGTVCHCGRYLKGE